MRTGKIVGIVSRADLLRTPAAAEPLRHAAPEHVARTRSQLAEAFAILDHHLVGAHSQEGTGSLSAPDQAVARGGLSAADFRSLVAGFEHRKTELADAAHLAAATQHNEKVKELIDEHVRDSNWNALLHKAREAAERGWREFQLLRFPSDLCIDGRRAINSALTDWPQTLRESRRDLFALEERIEAARLSSAGARA